LSWSIEVLSILTFSINVYLFLFYNRNSKFAYDDIKEVHKRRYLLQPIADLVIEWKPNRDKWKNEHTDTGILNSPTFTGRGIQIYQIHLAY
jgi:hypothetical protein